MPVMDEFKEEREALKAQPFKKKLEYFWSYYKWHTIGSIVGVILLFVLVRDIADNKENAFFGILVNTYPRYEDTAAFDSAIEELLEIDTDKYQVTFDYNFYMSEVFDNNSYQTTQMIMVHTAAGDVDVMAMDTYNFNKYGYNSYYADLRLYLSEEQLAALNDRIFYVDAALVAEIEEESINNSYNTEEPPYPENPFDPSTMKDPIPVGISLKGCEKFEEYFLYADDQEGFIGIFPGTKNANKMPAFIDYLFGLK